MTRRAPPTTWPGQVRVTEEGTPLCQGCGQHVAHCVCTLSCPPGRPPVLLAPQERELVAAQARLGATSGTQIGGTT